MSITLVIFELIVWCVALHDRACITFAVRDMTIEFTHNVVCVFSFSFFFFSFFFFFFSSVAKHIIVGRLFKNIHPSLQYSSRSLIHASLCRGAGWEVREAGWKHG